MPRDTTQLLEAPPDLTKPSLQGLAWLLRHKEAWPEGFVWCFQDCQTCAMGLLWRSMGEMPDWDNSRAQIRVAAFFALDSDTAYDIFQAMADTADDYIDVTPEMVADRIDAYLAGRSCS